MKDKREDEVAEEEDGVKAGHSRSNDKVDEEIAEAIEKSALQMPYVPRQAERLANKRPGSSSTVSLSSMNTDSSDEDLFEPIVRKRIRRPMRRRRLPSSPESGSSQESRASNDHKKQKIQRESDENKKNADKNKDDDEVEEPLIKTWRDYRVPEEIMNRIKARAWEKIPALQAEQEARHKAKREQEEKEQKEKAQKEKEQREKEAAEVEKLLIPAEEL